MAKKKAVKKVVKKTEDTGLNDNGTAKMPVRPVRAVIPVLPEKPEAIVQLENAMDLREMEIEGIIARIDNIVDAISKSKSVRGL